MLHDFDSLVKMSRGLLDYFWVRDETGVLNLYCLIVWYIQFSTVHIMAGVAVIKSPR